MEDKARFRKEVFGFNKDDVYDFIEGLYRNFDGQLKKKDEDMDDLKRHNNSLSREIEGLKDKLNGVEDYKANIADVLLKAKEQGEEIVKEAIEQGEQKRREMEALVDKEKERLESFKEDLRLLREGTIEVLSKFRGELDRITEDTDKDTE